MKVNYIETNPTFKPFTITVETEEEAKYLIAAIGHTTDSDIIDFWERKMKIKFSPESELGPDIYGKIRDMYLPEKQNDRNY